LDLHTELVCPFGCRGSRLCILRRSSESSLTTTIDDVWRWESESGNGTAILH